MMNGSSALAMGVGGDETPRVRCIKITNDGRGGSTFEEFEVSQASTPYVENVPPLLVSAAIAAAGVTFVTTPPEVRETKPHPAPRRQFAVVLEGQAEIVTTDGDQRTFSPGMFALFEDVDGQGHITNVVSPTPLTIMAVSVAD
jgi:hypothetical protein